MLTFEAVTSDYNPSAWDVQDSTGRRYNWGGDLSGTIRQARKLEALANEPCCPVCAEVGPDVAGCFRNHGTSSPRGR